MPIINRKEKQYETDAQRKSDWAQFDKYVTYILHKLIPSCEPTSVHPEYAYICNEHCECSSHANCYFADYAPNFCLLRDSLIENLCNCFAKGTSRQTCFTSFPGGTHYLDTIPYDVYNNKYNCSLCKECREPSLSTVGGMKSVPCPDKKYTCRRLVPKLSGTKKIHKMIRKNNFNFDNLFSMRKNLFRQWYLQPYNVCKIQKLRSRTLFWKR